MTLSGYIIIFLLIVIVGLFVKMMLDRRRNSMNAIEHLEGSVVDMFTTLKDEFIERLSNVQIDVRELDKHLDMMSTTIQDTFTKGTSNTQNVAESLGFEKE